MDAGGLEQTLSDGEADGFQAAMDVQFVENVTDVVAHGSFADRELASYFPCG